MLIHESVILHKASQTLSGMHIAEVGGNRLTPHIFYKVQNKLDFCDMKISTTVLFYFLWIRLNYNSFTL